MKYGLAVLACIGIFFVYAMIGAALGWRHGGGVIPMLILGATWRGITKSGKVSEKDTMTDDQK
jgi:hypothetical protein